MGGEGVIAGLGDLEGGTRSFAEYKQIFAVFGRCNGVGGDLKNANFGE